MNGALEVLSRLRASLPEPRDTTPGDIILGHILIFVSILALVPTPTPSVRIFRAALAPLLCAGWVFLSYVPLLRTPQERWGSSILFILFCFRTLEMLVLSPPEEAIWRVRDGQAEPVPPGWTWAKLEWATSAAVSLRGIGWNYSAPLSASQRSRPYDRHASRKEYIIKRSIYGLINLLIDDACGALMRRTAADFFITGDLKYADLTQWQRGFCSTLVVMRTVCSLEFTHVGFSLMFVLLGGLLGKNDHELLTPWGWPPMFASLKEIFSHPGLSYLWARAWQQYNRRMLHMWGWVFIGETLLGLPVSGVSSLATRVQRPEAKILQAVSALNDKGKEVKDSSIDGHKSPANGKSNGQSNRKVNGKPNGGVARHVLSATDTPMSGRLSPSNPIPAGPNVKANLIKSIVTFTLSGVHHDYGTLVLLLDQIGRGERSAIAWTEVFGVTSFFVIQPFGLVLEAIVKRQWRVVKRKQVFSERAASFIEFVLGNTWTWVWLGWTAGWYVRTLTEVGSYRAFPGKPMFSITETVWDWAHRKYVA